MTDSARSSCVVSAKSVTVAHRPLQAASRIQERRENRKLRLLSLYKTLSILARTPRNNTPVSNSAHPPTKLEFVDSPTSFKTTKISKSRPQDPTTMSTQSCQHQYLPQGQASSIASWARDVVVRSPTPQPPKSTCHADAAIEAYRKQIQALSSNQQ